MKNISVCFILLLTMGSCVRQSPVVKLFKEHIGKTVSLEGYDSVYHGDTAYSYLEFRERYPFITVNYIDENCDICRVKVREWCDNFDKIPLGDNLAHLFVFRGSDYKTFLRYSQGDIEFPFHIMVSKEFSYAMNNRNIDRQVIDGGFLLDRNNKIKIIGDPFLSEKMTDMYYKIISE